MGNIFAAVMPPPSVIREVERIQAMLKSQLGNVRWVNPHFFHLTLAFYGKIPLQTALKKFARLTVSAAPFSMRGMGWFSWRGKPRAVRVIHLVYMQEERTFHLTLGRSRWEMPVRMYEQACSRLAYSIEQCSFSPQEVLLIESLLTEGRQEYRIHARRRVS